MCITYSREAWIEGQTGGRGKDSMRNESGLERETNMMSRREIPLRVYLQGGGDRGTRREKNVCGVCVGTCGCEKITRPGGIGEALGSVPSCATLVGP